VTASPCSEYLLDQIVSERMVYYCADEYSCMPGMDAGLIRNLEASLLSKVDAVIVTSETLLETKRAAGKPISLLRHGVDTRHFSAADQTGHAGGCSSTRNTRTDLRLLWSGSATHRF
jgi:hypothetical protein